MNAARPLMPFRADWRTLFLLAALSASYFLGWTRGPVWFLVPSTILAVSACAAKHNHTHRPTFGRRFANRVMDIWLTVLTGSSTSGIRVAHEVRHHGRNQSADDFVRSSLVNGMPAFLALAAYVPRVYAESWRRRGCDLGAARRSALRRACLVERIILWTFIAAGLISDWPRFLLVFGVPWLLSQWFLIAMNLPQHDGCDEKSAWAHSRNVVGRYANWIFLNNGYHTAHHENPRAHWSDLPALHEQLVEPHLPQRLACASLTRFWLQWWRERGREAVRS